MPVRPKRPKGPALNALRAFETAARTGGFVTAAEELNVTPGAISQHVKALEAWAGAPLFRRHAQGVAVTPQGARIAKDLTEAFDALSAATQGLRNLDPVRDIHIAALPSVAQLWLPSRLGRLRQERPELNISVTALETPPRLTRDLFDLSVFLCKPEPSRDQIVLAQDVLFPVCAPEMAQDLDLTTAPLLHDQTWRDDWALWSASAGVPVGDPTRGPRYSLYGLAVEEAKSGAGVLMGHASLVSDALKSGALRPVGPATNATALALVVQLPPRGQRHPALDDIVALLRDAPGDAP